MHFREKSTISPEPRPNHDKSLKVIFKPQKYYKALDELAYLCNSDFRLVVRSIDLSASVIKLKITVCFFNKNDVLEKKLFTNESNHSGTIVLLSSGS